MEKAKIYEQLETASHRAYTRGIQTGNGGNLSARFDKGMIVKSSGGSLADCNKEGEGFVETTLEGDVLSENGKPKREVFLHGLMSVSYTHLAGGIRTVFYLFPGTAKWFPYRKPGSGLYRFCPGRLLYRELPCAFYHALCDCLYGYYLDFMEQDQGRKEYVCHRRQL